MSQHSTTIVDVVIRKMRPRLEEIIGENIELEIRAVSTADAVRAAPMDVERIVTALAACGRDGLSDGGIITLETRLAVLKSARDRTATPIAPGRYVVLSLSCSANPDAGLSTVREIVNACGAHLVVRNEEEADSVLEVYFRQLDSASTGARMQPKEGGAATILLAEDEDSVRHLARMILERQGYRVLEARNGAEAVRISQSHEGPIHLILADVVMPQRGGPEAVERLHHLRPEMRVLFLSGYSARVVATKDDTAYGRAYLRKPFTVDDLEQKVREVLDANDEPPAA